MKLALKCCIVLASIGLCGSAAARDLYVSPDGDDRADATVERPLRTIGLAVGRGFPGDRIILLPGTYRQAVVIERSGSEGKPIEILSSVPGKACLDGVGLDLEEDTGLVFIHDSKHIALVGIRILNSSRAGILIDGSAGIRIANCLTRNTYSSGIGVWSSSGVRIESNRVEIACNGGQQECITMAGSSDFAITGNTVCDGSADAQSGGEGIDVKDGSHGGLVSCNTVFNLPAKLGIYVDAWDKHTYGIEVSRNRVYRCTDGIVVASEAGGLLEDVQILNNLVYDNIYRGFVVGEWGLDGVGHPVRDILFANNTVYGNGDAWGYGAAIDNPQARGVVLRNNIFADNFSGAVVFGEAVDPADTLVDHNLFFGASDEGSLSSGSGAVMGDPCFADPLRGDFSLRGDSPAIDAGCPVAGLDADYEGRRRPARRGIDIGALENQR